MFYAIIIPLTLKKIKHMKVKQELYRRALAEVIDAFGVTEEELFYSNREACMQGRIVLIRTLSPYLSDSDIALLTPLRRCSICIIRNKYKEASAAWSVRRCIEVINNELKKEQP